MLTDSTLVGVDQAKVSPESDVQNADARAIKARAGETENEYGLDQRNAAKVADGGRAVGSQTREDTRAETYKSD